MATKRAKRDVENRDFMGFAQRIIAAAGRRVGSGDIDELPRLMDIDQELRLATLQAVIELRLDHGYSWQDLADRCSFSRQAAQKKWGAAVDREARRRSALDVS